MTASPAHAAMAIPRPGMLLGMSGNRAGSGVRPRLFARHPGTIIHHGDPLLLDPAAGQTVAEAELGIVLATGCHLLDESSARDAIAGWVVVNDVTVLNGDFPDGDIQAGKGLATPMSGMVEGDPDLDDLTIEVAVNGVVRSRGSAAGLILHGAALVAWISQTQRLLPGDIVLCGAPADAVPIAPGDRVRVSVGAVGVENPVVDLRGGA